MMLFVLPTLLLATVVGAKFSNTPSSSEYDYVIVGGGTAGCVLANRLSANPFISVALVEAGPSVLNDPRVLTIFTSLSPAIGTELDWNYTTTPQKYVNNSTLPYHAGRDLGGTSTINGMVYLRPAAGEFDVWSALGNPGLSWNNLLPYFERSEHLQLPTASQVSNGASFDPPVHGFTGPLLVGWYSGLNTSGYSRALNSTWQSLGLPWNSDPNTGNNAGLSLFPAEKNVNLNIREDAARAFYWPIAGRANLHTFANTTALRVTMDGHEGSTGFGRGAVAKGVEIVLPSGEKTVLCARREVILSAGTYRTPGLLEQSGIGNPSIFHNLSVTPRVSLPGVGAHLQDQWLITQIYDIELVAGSDGSLNAAPLTASWTATDLFGDERDSAAAQLRKDIPAYARIIAEASNGAISAADQEKVLNLRADLIFEKNATIATALFLPGAASAWGTMPFSTGSVHSSNDPSSPYVNPNFLQIPWDALVQSKISTALRKLFNTAPLTSYISHPPNSTSPAEIVPGYANIPANASVELWTAYYKQALAPVWHAVGSAGMRRRDWGGVVDENFRVYGTRGLRVVDGSVLPLQGNGNPTSTIYALAEKAADDLLRGWHEGWLGGWHGGWHEA